MVNEKEQLEFCEILDTWYLQCKGQFHGVHPLGMRKEDLKDLVCKWIETKKFSKNKEEMSNELQNLITDIEKHWDNVKNPKQNILLALKKIKNDTNKT